MGNSMKRVFESAKNKLSVVCGKMDALSPLMVLSRGYSITRSSEKEIIKSISGVKPGDMLEITVTDGSMICSVKEVNNS
jgi:exodeoxyribonuclease VII large subunit